MCLRAVLVLPSLSLLLVVLKLDLTECGGPDPNAELKFAEAKVIAETTLTDFFMMFWNCVLTTMPKQRFLVDDLQAFVFSPARTTVGLAPRFTSNRKFFSNLLATRLYKYMTSRDQEAIKTNFIKKIQFCDEVIMDENMLKEFYDREVDQSRLRK